MGKYWIAAAVLLVVIAVPAYFYAFPIRQAVDIPPAPAATTTKTALVANGCFWCVEADFEKLSGVIAAVSGYADGSGDHPTYEDYGARGFREVVEVTYDPTIVSYGALVEYMIKHGDPTDGEGSFYDRGYEYSPGVYYDTPEEKEEAERVIRVVEEKGVFDKPLAVTVTPRTVFWPAEEYHQDYYKKNPLKYAYYRHGSGRDAFIAKHWGEDVQPSIAVVASTDGTWRTFMKPAAALLKERLTPLQYHVTQEDGTERPFDNEYDGNSAEGIYVDVVSGEPLFSSTDKYNSGTGWPSFVKPLDMENIVLREDRSLFIVRTEVRSKRGDSHLGHVFNDGPAERGGLRWCMNSAALRFVPKEEMAAQGYEEYLNLSKRL